MNTIRQILDATKQAVGGSAWDYVHSLYLRYTINQGGVKGDLEQWQDTRTGRYAQRHCLGITSASEGFNGTLPWSQDAAGYPRHEENDDTQEGAANIAYRICCAWWYPERWEAVTDYIGMAVDDETLHHILHFTPKGGRIFELWIDATTNIMIRMTERAAFETVTYSFFDHRLVNGIVLPFLVYISNGHTAYDRQCVLQQVDLNLTHTDLEARLQMPSEPSPDFRIVNSLHSVEVPFRHIGNLILVDVSINGRETMPFILDTGGVNLVTPEAAMELQLETQGAFWGFGGGEDPVSMEATAVASMEFGGINLSSQVIWVYPFPNLKEILGINKLGGLLGYEVFRRLVVQVDYHRQQLTFTKPEHFTYHGDGVIVPFKFNSNIPEVEGDIDGIPGKFDLDTGNTGSLILNAPFVQKHGLASGYEGVEVQTGEGAGGGAVSFLVAHAECLRLGCIDVRDLPIALSLHRRGALSNPYAAGLVGAEVFQRFMMVFDYSRQEVIFNYQEY